MRASEISRRPASSPSLLHQIQPFTESLEERDLQLRPSPAGHDRSVGGTFNCEHIPCSSDQVVRDRIGRVGQCSMVNALCFPVNERMIDIN